MIEGKCMNELRFYPIQDIWFYLLVAFILEALAAYVLQYRKSKGAWPLGAALINRAVWLLSIVVIGTTENLETKLFGLIVQQMTAVLPCFFWLLFILQITNRDYLLNRRTLAVLLFVPGVIVVLLFSNGLYGLYWENIRLDGGVLILTRGMGNWLMLFYNYILILLILYMSILWISKCTGLRRQQAIICTLAPIIGVAGNSVWLFFQHTGLISPMPLSSLVVEIVWTYGFLYLKVINLLPLAQSKAVDVVGNGLLVIDNEGWVVDLNNAAASLFELTPAEIEGKQVAELFAKWPSLLALSQKKQKLMQEISIEKDNKVHVYELHIIELSEKRDSSIGKAFIWKDITVQRRVQEQLIQQEKTLSILAERNRISRDFHDGPAQLGSFLQIELQTIIILLNKERIKEAKEQVERLLEIAKDFNTEVRETIEDLKTEITSLKDFLQIIKNYLEQYQEKYGIKTEFVHSPQAFDKIIEPIVALQLLRIIQEATNNVRKHAKATKVLVTIELSVKKVVLSIDDDGQGFDLSSQSLGQNNYGISIMRERATDLGGQFWIESHPRVGTKIIIEIPFGKAEQYEDIVS